MVLGFGVQGVGFEIHDSGFKVSEFRGEDSGFRF
jgi:hypothetical protein